MVAWSAGQLSAGIEKLFWFDGQDNFYYHWHVTKNLFEYREPTPLFLAYALLTKVLDGLPHHSDQAPENGVRVIQFEAEENRVLVVFGPPGTRATTLLPEGLVAFDYLARPVQPDSEGRVSLARGPLYMTTATRAARSLGTTAN